MHMHFSQPCHQKLFVAYISDAGFSTLLCRLECQAAMLAANTHD